MKKAFVDAEGIKRANLKDKFLFWRFAAIQTALMMGKAATQTSISYLEWLGRLKVSSDWFGCVLIKEMTKGSKHQLRNSLRWPIYVINSVYDTKLPCSFYHRLFYVVTWIWSVDTCMFVLWLRHWGESKPFTKTVYTKAFKNNFLTLTWAQHIFLLYLGKQLTFAGI